MAGLTHEAYQKAVDQILGHTAYAGIQVGESETTRALPILTNGARPYISVSPYSIEAPQPPRLPSGEERRGS